VLSVDYMDEIDTPAPIERKQQQLSF
jgi:hypothetical protein